MVVGALDMYEVGALQTEDARVGGTDIDHAVMVFTETEELQFGTVGEIAPYLVPVITEQAFAVGDEPQAPFLVFDHRVDGMEVGQLATHLLGVGLVDELHHTET